MVLVVSEEWKSTFFGQKQFSFLLKNAHTSRLPVHIVQTETKLSSLPFPYAHF